jgi:hypothetical protein
MSQSKKENKSVKGASRERILSEEKISFGFLIFILCVYLSLSIFFFYKGYITPGKPHYDLLGAVFAALCLSPVQFLREMWPRKRRQKPSEELKRINVKCDDLLLGWAARGKTAFIPFPELRAGCKRKAITFSRLASREKRRLRAPVLMAKAFGLVILALFMKPPFSSLYWVERAVAIFCIAFVLSMIFVIPVIVLILIPGIWEECMGNLRGKLISGTLSKRGVYMNIASFFLLIGLSFLFFYKGLSPPGNFIAFLGFVPALLSLIPISVLFNRRSWWLKCC